MKKIIKLLKDLKKINAVAVKQSLEDEGASYEDLIVMRKLLEKQKLLLNVKIGGCEAKNDIFFCEKIGVSGMVAPMVESPYALKKFLQTIPSKNKQSLYVNIESIQAFNNITKLLNQKNINRLKGVVIGRSDLAGSLNLSKSEVNSKRIYQIVFLALRKKLKKNLLVKMGGSLTAKSKEFVKELFKKLIDRVETRNIEIKLSKKVLEDFEEIISSVFRFELEWLKYKQTLQKKENLNLKMIILKELKF